MEIEMSAKEKARIAKRANEAQRAMLRVELELKSPYVQTHFKKRMKLATRRRLLARSIRGLVERLVKEATPHGA